jgi:hypothetical protein
MDSMFDIIVTVLGFVIVNVLSLIIAARIRKFLTATVALFTHIFLIVIACYYLIDFWIVKKTLVLDPYLYLWLAIILTQLWLFLRAFKNQNVLSKEQNG